MGRSQVVRQRILIPPFGGSSPPAPARQSINQQLLSGVLIFCDVDILNVILRLILIIRCRRVRQPMSVTLASCRERALHCALGIALISLLALVRREGAALTVS